VKPLDCLFWPLTLEFDPKANEIDILLGDCHFIREIEKLGILEEWVAKETEKVIQQLPNFSKNDLIAFNSMDDVPYLKLVCSIPLTED
jgi:hypothetical protein